MVFNLVVCVCCLMCESKHQTNTQKQTMLVVLLRLLFVVGIILKSGCGAGVGLNVVLVVIYCLEVVCWHSCFDVLVLLC